MGSKLQIESFVTDDYSASTAMKSFWDTEGAKEMFFLIHFFLNLIQDEIKSFINGSTLLYNQKQMLAIHWP